MSSNGWWHDIIIICWQFWREWSNLWRNCSFTLLGFFSSQQISFGQVALTEALASVNLIRALKLTKSSELICYWLITYLLVGIGKWHFFLTWLACVCESISLPFVWSLITIDQFRRVATTMFHNLLVILCSWSTASCKLHFYPNRDHQQALFM